MATDASGATTSRLAVVSRGLFSMRWLYDLKPEPREMCTRSDESCRCTPRAKISSADRPRYNACTQRACSLKRNTISWYRVVLRKLLLLLRCTQRAGYSRARRGGDQTQFSSRPDSGDKGCIAPHTHTHTHARTHARILQQTEQMSAASTVHTAAISLIISRSVRHLLSPLVPRDSLSTRHRRSVPRQTCSRSSCD